MDLILLIAGIFAGIGIFLATMYSVTQILLLEGKSRTAHAVALTFILIVMACLMERWIDTARVFALPMIAASIWVAWIEPRWYKIFPVSVVVFGSMVAAGIVRPDWSGSIL